MQKPTQSRDGRQPALSRRTVFAGVGVVGATAAAAAVMPALVEKPAPATTLPSQRADGYQLTEHVQRYYRTAKV